MADRLELPVGYFLGGGEDSTELAAQVLAEEAEMALDRRQPQECLHLLDEAERTARYPLDIRTVLCRARAFGEIGQSAGAVTLLREHLHQADQSDDLHFRAEYRYAFGGTLYRTGSFDEAHLHLRRALDDAQETGEDPILIGKIMVGIGHILFVQRDIDPAIRHYHAAIEFFGAVRDYHTQGTIYAGLSLAFKRKGNLTQALEYARLGASMFRASNDLREMAVLLNNMAVALQESGDIEKAEEIALQALGRAEQVHAVDAEAGVHSTLAAIYLAGEKLDEAAHEAGLARELSGDDHGPAQIASSVTLARIAELQGDLERADELYRRALQHLQEAGRRTRYAEIALAYSELLERRGDMAAAVQYAREAARTQVAAVPEA